MPYFPPIQQDQYPATDEVQCIEVKIPAGDEFKALLAGLMVSAADVNNYADPSSAAADGLAAIWDQAYSEIDWEGCAVPTEPGLMSRITFWHSSAERTVNDAGNAVATTYDTSQIMAFYARQNPPTLNSQSSQPCRLQAGSWAMRMLYMGNTTSGIIQLYWLKADFSDNGAIGASLDMYADGYNQFHTGTFTIPEDGDYRITWSNIGKNASSSSYSMFITYTEIWRTGD